MSGAMSGAANGTPNGALHGESRAPTLADLAAMPREEFVATLGGIFEHAPWVAEAAVAGGPYPSLDALHAAMLAVVREAPPERRLAFLNGHPELAGREAAAGTLTDHSTDEQRSAGLDALGAEQIDVLRQLNAAYRERHGFPFIVAARGLSWAGIVRVLRDRLARSTAVEHDEALAQVARITRGRLDALIRPLAS